MNQAEDRISGLKRQNRGSRPNEQETFKKRHSNETTQEMWGTMEKTPNLQIINEGEESQISGTDQIFNKTIAGKVPKLRKTHTYKNKRHTEHQVDKMRKENPNGILQLKHEVYIIKHTETAR